MSKGRGIQCALTLIVAIAILPTITTAGCGGGGAPSSQNSGGGTTSNPPTGNGSAGVPDLGAEASLNGKQVFPSDNPWNQRVDSLPLDPNSDAIIDHIGRSAPLHPDFGSDPTYGIS